MSACGSGGGGSGAAPSPPLVVTPTPEKSLFDTRRAALAVALGKPNRLLLGLGATDLQDAQAQNLQPDIYDTYINDVGPTSWAYWNLPKGAFIQKFAAHADAIGAVPMFSLYQMASNGDGNLSGLKDIVFMQQYWDNVRLLFTQLNTYNKPALVSFETDFWGYTHRLNSDPTVPFAQVMAASGGDCPTAGDHIKGIATCLLSMARKYAPKAYVGFPPSNFGDLVATEADYLKRLGADQADFVAVATLDRDVGCFEAQNAAAACNRAGSLNSVKLWDENNITTPNFRQHFAVAKNLADTLQRPLIWWQTPMGVPSSIPGGSPKAWRDNRAAYFLTHANELVAAGGLGVVFGPGEVTQTNINTDGGQYKRLSTAYLAKPTALP